MLTRRSIVVAGTGLLLVAAVVFLATRERSEPNGGVEHSRASHSSGRRLDGSRAKVRPATREVIVDDAALDLGAIVERTHFAFQPQQV
jgi:hypothetical protein